jgi:RNA polymerase sigma-70 factor, ECF subfamily
MEQTAEKSQGAASMRLTVRPKLPLQSKRLRQPVRKTTPEVVVKPVRIPLKDESDQDLMKFTQEGEQAAFAIIFERYSASVLSYLYRMLGSVEDVESIAQEVFLRAYRFRATYRYPQRLSTWLFTITRNLAINQARRRGRNPVKSVTELNLDGIDISGDPCRVAAGATVDAEKKEEIARVLKALDELPTDQKEVIVLGVFQDLSYAEMESITGAKAVTLRSRMFHGLKKLSRMLKDED